MKKAVKWYIRFRYEILIKEWAKIFGLILLKRPRPLQFETFYNTTDGRLLLLLFSMNLRNVEQSFWWSYFLKKYLSHQMRRHFRDFDLTPASTLKMFFNGGFSTHIHIEFHLQSCQFLVDIIYTQLRQKYMSLRV